MIAARRFLAAHTTEEDGAHPRTPLAAIVDVAAPSEAAASVPNQSPARAAKQRRPATTLTGGNAGFPGGLLGQRRGKERTGAETLERSRVSLKRTTREP